MIHGIKDDPILQDSQSGTINILQLWLQGWGGVLDSLPIMLKILILSQKSQKPTPKELE